jgi:hypothetical protein
MCERAAITLHHFASFLLVEREWLSAVEQMCETQGWLLSLALSRAGWLLAGLGMLGI